MSREKTAIPDDLLQVSQRLEEWRRESAAITAAGGGRDGAAAWTALHDEGPATGLHAVEEAAACWSAVAWTDAAEVPGTDGLPREGAAECVVEVESSRGRMRVAMKGASLDWAGLLGAWRES